MQTDQLKTDIRTNVYMSHIEETFDKPAFNQTALKILLDNLRIVRENTGEAIGALEKALYLTRPAENTDSFKQLLIVSTCSCILRICECSDVVLFLAQHTHT